MDTKISKNVSVDNAQVDAAPKAIKKIPRTRIQARSDFKMPGKDLIELNTDFMGFKIDGDRANVQLELDSTVNDRLSQPHIKTAAEYAKVKSFDLIDTVNLKKDVKGLLDIAVARKLVQALPASKEEDIMYWNPIRKGEWFVPPNFYAFVAQMGKTDHEDLVIRYKYDSLDINRMILQLLKDFSGREGFEEYVGMHKIAIDIGGEVEVPWARVDTSAVVFPDNTSTKWIQDQAVTWLKSTLNISFPVMVDGREVQFSYPYLDLSGERRDRMRNIANWLNLLVEGVHPDIEKLAAAALLSVWKTEWTQQAEMTFDDLGVNVPGFGNLTPAYMLDVFDVMVFDHEHDMPFNAKVFFKNMFKMLQDSIVQFQDFMEMVKLPKDDFFGSVAQLVPVEAKFKEHVRDPVSGHEYWRIKDDVVSVVYQKLQATHLVSVGMVASFTKSVKVEPAYQARLKDDPDAILRRRLIPDVINFKRK